MKPLALVLATAMASSGCVMTFEEARLVRAPKGSEAAPPPRDEKRCQSLADEQRGAAARASALSYVGGATGLATVGAGLKDLDRNWTLGLGIAAVAVAGLSLWQSTAASSTGVQWAKECSAGK